MTPNTTMKTHTLAQLKDEFIGICGTKAREKYEFKLSMEVLGFMIKNVWQEQLGNIENRRLQLT